MASDTAHRPCERPPPKSAALACAPKGGARRACAIWPPQCRGAPTCSSRSSGGSTGSARAAIALLDGWLKWARPHRPLQTPDVFDYGRALHDIQLNAWVLAYRQLLGPQLVAWHGERQITPPREARQAQARLDDHWSIEGLRDPHPRPVVPDATLEIADQERAETRLFLLEFDRSSRTDKNYDKFRRYDAYLAWWWRHTELARRAEAPYVLFICQHDAQRDDFLTRADRELTGHRWHPSCPAHQHEYIGRRRILFCNERDIHLGYGQARRLPPYPPGHPARHGREAEIRHVRLPGPVTGDDAGLMRRGEKPSAVEEPDGRDSTQEAA
jgi:hypothetical protein